MNKKQIKRAIKKNVKIAGEKGADLKKIAVKEYAKIKKEMNIAAKKVEGYVKKNPEKAALISAAIGAAIGAAVTGVIVAASKKKKK